jgi:hypothetical protein
MGDMDEETQIYVSESHRMLYLLLRNYFLNRVLSITYGNPSSLPL